jgi:hypothetical protein
MPARRLLYLDATGLTAYRWQSGRLRVEGEYAAEPAGVTAFGEYIAREHSSVFYLLTDYAEEGYQVEQVPHVRGSDRSALIKRKLVQYFFGTPHALALSLGRSNEGRRDERLLLTALTRSDQIEPWLDALHAAEGQLAGIYSLPIVAPQLIPLLGISAPHILLISITRGGLRQTLFEDGRLAFSRVTALATGSIDEMAITCAAESEKMYQYMAGQRLILRGSRLTTLVLTHPAQMTAFRDVCTDTPSLHFEFVDLLALAKTVGLHTPPHDTRADILFLHLTAKRPPREQFAPESDRHHYRLDQLRFGLRTAGYVILSAALLFAFRQAVDYHSISQRTVDIVAQTQQDRQRYDSMLQSLPKIPISNDALRALISRYDKLRSAEAGPEPTYLLISQALHASPRVDIKRIDWQRDSSKDTKGGEIAELHAMLPLSMAGDPRSQLAAIDAFAEQLSARKLQVQKLKLPFDAESTKSLKSSTEAAAQTQSPQFSLRISRSLP